MDYRPARAARACSRSLALYLEKTVSPWPGRNGLLAMHSLALSLHCRGFLFAGNVLEELLDQVDVGEDHAAAAVACETELVEGITVRGLG